MKDLQGSAARTVAADPAHCFAVLADVERYQAWYPEVIRQVTVVERRPDGGVALAEATLSAPGVPLIGDLELRLAVELEAANVVRLVRVPNHAGDEEQFEVAWRLSPAPAESTALAVRITARLPVPRLVPLTGLGDRIAGGFLRAAERAVGVEPG